MTRRLAFPLVLAVVFAACAEEALPPAGGGDGSSGDGGAGHGGSGAGGDGGSAGSGSGGEGGSGNAGSGGGQAGSGGGGVADPCDDPGDQCNGGECHDRVIDCGAAADFFQAFCDAGSCNHRGTPGDCALSRDQVLANCTDQQRTSPTSEAQWFCSSTVDACPGEQAYQECLGAECAATPP